MSSPDPTEKAEQQRQAAHAAVALLQERLGPDFGRFVDLFEIASFRFRPALIAAAPTPVRGP